jgi:hypothetical protein
MSLGAISAVLLALLVAAVPTAAAPSSPYLAALGSIDGALRFAIEQEPEGLAKSLATSERVCSLGQGAEDRGDAAAAEADWSTLSQTVEQLDRPGLSAVERSFAAATESVHRVESRFSRGWSGQPDRVRALHRGAASVQRGLSLLSGSFGDLRDAFAAWEAHRCEVALAAVDSFTEAIPKGMPPINRGMERLWRISRWSRSDEA